MPLKARARTVWELEGTSFPLALMKHQSGDFSVHYGKQIKTGLNYTQAAHELGACILHDLQCGGVLDD